MARKGFGRGRGRPKKAVADELVQGTERQITIDWTVEAKVEAFDENADLRRRIDALAAVAADANKEKRALEKKKLALERQAAAGKRAITVEIEERADFEHGVVTTHRRDTGDQISEREMTDSERSSGSVLTGRGPVSRIAPGDAASVLAEVAAHVGSNGAAHDVLDGEEYPLPSTNPADVAGVIAAVQQ